MKKQFMQCLVLILVFHTTAINQQKKSSNVKPLFKIEKNGKFGYIDRTGKIIVSPQYDKAYEFSEGLAAVMKGDKSGFIDHTGKVVIEIKFDKYPDSFHEGLAHVRLNKEPCFIDKSGKIIFKHTFEHSYYPFSEGLTPINQNKKYGFMDKTGTIVINPTFSNANSFSEGFAAVKVDKKWGYINKEGQIVIKSIFDYCSKFSEGVALVKIGNRYGYIDSLGNNIIESKFTSAASFTENLALVSEGPISTYINFATNITKLARRSKGYQLGKLFFINKTGNTVVDLEKLNVNEILLPGFSEGLVGVRIGGNKWGYMDKAGKLVIEPKFDMVRNFSNGLASVQKNGIDYYIDKTGKIIWSSVE